MIVLGEIGPEARSDIVHITVNMRADDAREIYALRWDDEPLKVVEETIAPHGFGWVFAADDGEPVAVLGAQPQRPGVWNVFMFATDRFDEIKFELTKFAVRVMMRVLIDDRHAHRIEAQSIVGHEIAQRWMTRCFGAKQEALLEGYGRQGEDYLVFAWRPETDVRRQTKGR